MQTNATVAGGFTISLDFELMWGVFDSRSVAEYGGNILGTRAAISGMLACFAHHDVGVTWATVGLLMCASREEMLARIDTSGLHDHRPDLAAYINANVGQDAESDPYHFGKDILESIQRTPRQEIASHSFSHYGVLEAYASTAGFEADLVAVAEQFKYMDLELNSFVFARNQIAEAYIDSLKRLDVACYRGCPEQSFYLSRSPKENGMCLRMIKLLDSYLPLTNLAVRELGVKQQMLDTIASRFLRPLGRRRQVLNSLQVRRIQSEMTTAAKRGQFYHLWWHPHNFGLHTELQLEMLDQILSHFSILRKKYGWQSMNMGELARINQVSGK